MSIIHYQFLLLLLLFLLIPETLFAQRWRQPWGPWSGELATRTSILLDDEVLYVGARLNHELSANFTLGLALVVLTEQATRRTHDALETIELLGSIGPSIEFTSQLRGRVDYYLSVAGGVGYARRRKTSLESEALDAGLYLSVEPEIGVLGRLSRRIRVRLGLSGMAGMVDESRRVISGGPTVTFGVRVGL